MSQGKNSLKKSVFSNLIWRLAERIGAKSVELVVSIVIARILTPNDYGIIALVTVFMAIMQVFVDSGLGNALIQKKDADDEDFSTVFYTNVVFCIILYLILFFLSPIIASFYDNPSLTAVIRVLGITILISGIKNVQQAYVSKKMIFKKFFFSTLAGTVGAGIIGIILAYRGFGVWALVAQQIFNLTLDTLVLWITVKWRPKKLFSFHKLKTLFRYGWKLLASSLLDVTYNNVRQLVIGKIYTSSDLAYYNKAKQFPELIVSNINTSIDSVLLPAMSKEQEDKAKIKAMVRRSIKISTFIMAPLMMGLAFTANNLVIILLTEKWSASIPFLSIFAITYMFWPIHTSNLNAIKAVGRSDLFLKMEIMKKVVGVILLLSTMFISVWAMTLSLLVSTVISMIINSYPNRKLLNYNLLQQLKDILPSILLATAMGALVYLINFLELSPLITFMIQVPTGALIYFAGAKILKIDSFQYCIEILKEIKDKKKKNITF